jgi:SAM-dependent methyltransferase
MLAPLRAMMQAAHAPIYHARKRELVRLILPHLQPHDRILDVGCGVGTLGHALMTDPRAPAGLIATGLERFARGGEPIPVRQYDGRTIPDPDRSHDVAIVADVLHHDTDPDAVVRECARVAKRLVIIKDHQIKGPLALPRISLIDWAANAPHGVPCLYRYNTPAQWAAFPGRFGLTTVEARASINLYPPLVNLLFGRSLQYLGVYAVPGHTGPPVEHHA